MPRKRGGAVSARLTKDFIKASYEATPRREIDGFIYDPSVSATTARVYHNPTTGQTILTNRGTEGTLSDWGNNLAYTFGRHKNTKRFKEAERVQQMAEAKYGASNISQISHSQGAIYGRELGKNVKEHISLNPAYKGEKENENEYVVKSSLDPVSNAYGQLKKAVTPKWFSLFQRKKPTKEKVIEAKTWNPVEEHLTGVLDRLDSEHQLGKVGSGRKKGGRKKLIQCGGGVYDNGMLPTWENYHHLVGGSSGYSTPPPFVPLTHTQGQNLYDIVTADAPIRLKVIPLRYELQSIGGENEGVNEDNRLRFRNYINGRNNSSQIREIMNLFDAILRYDERSVTVSDFF